MTVCRAVKKRLIAGGVGDPKRKRNIAVGHAGTLDPLASGLLIVLVGRATRWCEKLMAGEKTYLAEIDLAHHSQTDDLEGELVSNPIDAATAPTRDAVESILQSRFTGTIQQVPPAYSAMLIDGRRAYKLARAGKAPELQPRPIQIHEIHVHGYAFSKLTIEVRCGKGTYIRSLARDIGLAATGHAAVLTALRRTAIGPYKVDDATPLEQLPPTMTLADLKPLIEQ
jgi:tRNA pseudouridine55 synthase